LSPAAGGTWTEKVLYSFGANPTDGITPLGSLIFDAKGNLYGTTEAGGAYDTTFGGASNGYGTVFELTPATGSAWTEKVLYSFRYLSQTDGYYPVAGVIFDTKGNLYGTTSDGGAGQDLEGGGTVFELTPTTGGSWTEKVLYSFGGGSPSGYKIEGGVIFDTAGNLYGTANAGGNAFGLDGTLFKLTPTAGGTWTETVLHSFGAYETDGINPTAGLIFDGSGNLYGTTSGGGANTFGTVFKLTTETGGSWTETVLHSFNFTSTDGASPYAGLVLDTSGNLYGTTAYGGANGSSDSGTTGGTVFEIASTITKAATATTLVSSLNPSAFDQAVIFTATVKSATSGTPAGTVTFKNGTTTLGTGTLSAGKATLTTSILAVGVHSITAVYGGGADYNVSTSPVLTQTVN